MGKNFLTYFKIKNLVEWNNMTNFANEIKKITIHG